ncbi:hypothetical protein MEJ65_00260 [Candidatus Carsonella ruddii]|uniref:Uncharacterized protein n=1 Tax=Carsonella ruddii TaxID=114186 RepID=A0AAJ6FCG5_CARRU|nr:hypothetical protein [Candidatus Carsonella ruddii]WGS66715.1 hypothetical protein MEJ66_00265 [Candidatus Carsonella ruddii]WGS66909.1 hypothetical protein MEJ62_00255 [Candidatus Carsonella ruddii]WGS67101.1 hypothetical protein MEJ60_00255 [Candidatus Carsonella ruddii]WGS67294.1 hypothetical protein MEJ65_00260 [Candidatus Carsonella ruddii]WMC18310.1 MAG: hypothetical protein NU472_00260 [Candidatus Carsonella ruddii]
MKLKYNLKIFKKTKKNNNKILIGSLILKKKIINVYIIKKNFLKKIFHNNFLIIIFSKKKYFTYIKHIKFRFVNNEIDFFVLEEIQNYFFIKYFNDKRKIFKKIIFKNNKTNNIFPRKINLNVIFNKKILKDCDFNLKNFLIKKKKLFFN